MVDGDIEGSCGRDDDAGIAFDARSCENMGLVSRTAGSCDGAVENEHRRQVGVHDMVQRQLLQRLLRQGARDGGHGARMSGLPVAASS